MNKNLINRLEKGYEKYKENKYNLIIVCGGIVEKNVLHRPIFKMR